MRSIDQINRSGVFYTLQVQQSHREAALTVKDKVIEENPVYPTVKVLYPDGAADKGCLPNDNLVVVDW